VNKKQKLDSPFTEVVQIEAYRGEPKLSTLLRELPWSSNRSLSPALITDYQTRLPDKKLLQAKLHEFYIQNAQQEDKQDQTMGRRT
jgi:hypothetical protein